MDQSSTTMSQPTWTSRSRGARLVLPENCSAGEMKRITDAYFEESKWTVSSSHILAERGTSHAASIASSGSTVLIGAYQTLDQPGLSNSAHVGGGLARHAPLLGVAHARHSKPQLPSGEQALNLSRLKSTQEKPVSDLSEKASDMYQNIHWKLMDEILKADAHDGGDSDASPGRDDLADLHTHQPEPSVGSPEDFDFDALEGLMAQAPMPSQSLCGSFEVYEQKEETDSMQVDILESRPQQPLPSGASKEVDVDGPHGIVCQIERGCASASPLMSRDPHPGPSMTIPFGKAQWQHVEQKGAGVIEASSRGVGAVAIMDSSRAVSDVASKSLWPPGGRVYGIHSQTHSHTGMQIRKSAHDRSKVPPSVSASLCFETADSPRLVSDVASKSLWSPHGRVFDSQVKSGN